MNENQRRRYSTILSQELNIPTAEEKNAAYFKNLDDEDLLEKQDQFNRLKREFEATLKNAVAAVVESNVESSIHSSSSSSWDINLDNVEDLLPLVEQQSEEDLSTLTQLAVLTAKVKTKKADAMQDLENERVAGIHLETELEEIKAIDDVLKEIDKTKDRCLGRLVVETVLLESVMKFSHEPKRLNLAFNLLNQLRSGNMSPFVSGILEEAKNNPASNELSQALAAKVNDAIRANADHPNNKVTAETTEDQVSQLHTVIIEDAILKKILDSVDEADPGILVAAVTTLNQFRNRELADAIPAIDESVGDLQQVEKHLRRIQVRHYFLQAPTALESAMLNVAINFAIRANEANADAKVKQGLAKTVPAAEAAKYVGEELDAKREEMVQIINYESALKLIEEFRHKKDSKKFEPLLAIARDATFTQEQISNRLVALITQDTGRSFDQIPGEEKYSKKLLDKTSLHSAIVEREFIKLILEFNKDGRINDQKVAETLLEDFRANRRTDEFSRILQRSAERSEESPGQEPTVKKFSEQVGVLIRDRVAYESLPEIRISPLNKVLAKTKSMGNLKQKISMGSLRSEPLNLYDHHYSGRVFTGQVVDIQPDDYYPERQDKITIKQITPHTSQPVTHVIRLSKFKINVCLERKKFYEFELPKLLHLVPQEVLKDACNILTAVDYKERVGTKQGSKISGDVAIVNNDTIWVELPAASKNVATLVKLEGHEYGNRPVERGMEIKGWDIYPDGPAGASQSSPAIEPHKGRGGRG